MEFDLLKELEHWTLDADTLAEKYGFERRIVYRVETAPQYIKFGQGEFLATFHCWENGIIQYISLTPNLPTELRPPCFYTEPQYSWFPEWHEAIVDYCKDVLVDLYGEGYKEMPVNKPWVVRGYKWETGKYDIETSWGNDIKGVPLSGRIDIYLKTIKGVLLHEYFYKLKDLYKKEFGTLPTVSYQEKDKSLFEGEPDKDGEVQWMWEHAERMGFDGLPDDLVEFYNSWYYWSLCGKVKGVHIPRYTDNEDGMVDISFYFPHTQNKEAVLTQVKYITDKEIYDAYGGFPIASCDVGEMDCIELCEKKDGSLFLYDYGYDPDNPIITPLDMRLIDIFTKMEPII